MGFPRKPAAAAASLAALALVATSCNEPSALRVCHPAVYFAVVMEVRDAMGQPAAAGAELTARHEWRGATLADTALRSDDPLILRVGTRPGTFALTLKKPGYATWTRDRVVVPVADEACEVPETVHMTATLIPAT